MVGVLAHLKRQVGPVMQEEYQVLLEQILRKTGAQQPPEEPVPAEEERHSMVVMDQQDGNINLVQVPRNVSSEQETYSQDHHHQDPKVFQLPEQDEEQKQPFQLPDQDEEDQK